MRFAADFDLTLTFSFSMTSTLASTLTLHRVPFRGHSGGYINKVIHEYKSIFIFVYMFMYIRI